MQTRTVFSVAPRVTTVFCCRNVASHASPDAAERDILVLDTFDSILNSTDIEWSWVVDTGTALALKASAYSYSSDKLNWVLILYVAGLTLANHSPR
jgi:hypothetical protein